MKHLNLMLPLVSIVLLFSCKKLIQQQEEKEAEKIVTNGLWYVSGYEQNDSDITASFSGYLFKFDNNSTVTGTRNDSSVQGQWSVNINAKTITANFPGAGDPLDKLNETWLITDSYTDSVSARSTDTVNHTSNILQLKK